MRLNTKTLLAQAPLAPALILLGATAVTTLKRLGYASEKILQDNYRSVLAATEAVSGLAPQLCLITGALPPQVNPTRAFQPHPYPPIPQ